MFVLCNVDNAILLIHIYILTVSAGGIAAIAVSVIVVLLFVLSLMLILRGIVNFNTSKFCGK